MVSSSGNTKQELASIDAKINMIAMESAYESLSNLIKTLPQDELYLVLPTVKLLISRFFKKKNKALNTLLDERLGSNSVGYSISDDERRLQQYVVSLNKLESSHIFQWATYYRDTVEFIFKDLCDFLDVADDWENILLTVSSQFRNHASSISRRGIQHSLSNGLSDEASQYKSVGGLQQFLYLVMNLYVDHQEKIINSKNARIARYATSTILSSILSGYSQNLGWDRLCSSYRQWVPALGFMSGADAISLFQDSNNISVVPYGVFDTIVPVLLAIDKLSNKFHGSNFISPRLSVVLQHDPLKLDIILTTGKAAVELTISSVFSEVIDELIDIEELNSFRDSLTIVRVSPIVKNWIEQRDHFGYVDVTHVAGLVDSAQDVSEIIAALLEKKISFNKSSDNKHRVSHNYAMDFPLEDPDTRKLFIVERHSVKLSLERFERGTGIHLWCSVRRSGKTTAALNLSSRSAVVFQTMDFSGDQPQLNIFVRAIQECLQSQIPLPNDFFNSIVHDCIKAAGMENLSKQKVVFLLDEYESFFGILGAMADANQIIKFNIVLPLMSQMVRFASKNLLIFMGQRPDAYHIIPSQNQLSPLVKHQYFPLFEHHVGGAESEFSQFLSRVLTHNLQFSPSFTDAVFAETSGHPYLTVNLMVDFCDWIVSSNIENSVVLDANRFQLFSKERLSLATLSRSTYYHFFQNQLGGYLTEQTRQNERWLYAIARVLQQIGIKHPKALSCPMARYNEFAMQALATTTMTPQVLLSSAILSNFLKKDDGHVKPAIKLMARLAACSLPELI